MIQLFLTASIFSLAIFSFSLACSAQEHTYDIKDPKGVNSIGITLDSVLEPIRGYANGISGQVKFDPQNPQGISGKIVVDAKSIQMTIGKMTEVLHGEEWLNVQKYPTVTATFKKLISHTKTGKNQHKVVVKGDFTCKGKTKELQATVYLTHHPGKLKARNHKGEGDLLVIRTEFAIDRHDFGIKPAMDNTIVARKIDLDIAVVGHAGSGS